MRPPVIIIYFDRIVFILFFVSYGIISLHHRFFRVVILILTEGINVRKRAVAEKSTKNLCCRNLKFWVKFILKNTYAEGFMRVVWFKKKAYTAGDERQRIQQDHQLLIAIVAGR